MKTTDQIAPIARRHGLSEEAARMLWRALQASGGGLAQFDHPELGGEGHWMLGMTMIGEMSNTRLKARVEGHCTDLAAPVTGRGEAETTQVQAQSQ